jgi:cytochrome c-type biogenesis protein CcmF
MAIGGIFSISDKRYRIKKMAKWKNVGGAKSNNDADNQPTPAEQQPQGNKGSNLAGEQT